MPEVPRLIGEYRIGDLVYYHSTLDDVRQRIPFGDVREVRTEVELIGGTPVLWVSGITACVAVSHLLLVKQVEDREDFKGVEPPPVIEKQGEFGF